MWSRVMTTSLAHGTYTYACVCVAATTSLDTRYDDPPTLLCSKRFPPDLPNIHTPILTCKTRRPSSSAPPSWTNPHTPIRTYILLSIHLRFSLLTNNPHIYLLSTRRPSSSAPSSPRPTPWRPWPSSRNWGRPSRCSSSSKARACCTQEHTNTCVCGDTDINASV